MLYTPMVPRAPDAPNPSRLPLMLYCPGALQNCFLHCSNATTRTLQCSAATACGYCVFSLCVRDRETTDATGRVRENTNAIGTWCAGIDGTGLAAYRQFPSLSRHFDLRALFMPPGDTDCNFQDVVDATRVCADGFCMQSVAVQVCCCTGLEQVWSKYGRARLCMCVQATLTRVLCSFIPPGDTGCNFQGVVGATRACVQLRM